MKTFFTSYYFCYCMMVVEPIIYEFEDVSQTNNVYECQPSKDKVKSKTPIVIDFGSYCTRAGYAGDSKPSIVFDSIVNKYQEKKGSTSFLDVGNDPKVLEFASKIGTRPYYDQNIIYQFDYLEQVMDHIFRNLIGPSETTLPPLFITESYGNLASSRSQLMELLFECYGVPKVSLSTDLLLSFHANNLNQSADGLIVSFGHHCCYVVPVLDGKADHQKSKRLNLGGFHLSEYMFKSLQLKYPSFPTRLLPNQAQCFVHRHCYVAQDYLELVRMKSPQSLDFQIFSKESNIMVQFPYAMPPPLSHEELEEKEAKRKENAQRMREANEKMRAKKMEEKELELDNYKIVKFSRESLKKKDYLDRVKSLGFKREEDLDAAIAKLEASVKKYQNRLAGIPEPETLNTIAVVPEFPLLSRPDSELTEEEIKEKRKQRLMKSNYDARERIRQEKEQALILQRKREEEREAERLRDPVAWVSKLRQQRKEIRERIKERSKRKALLQDKRSHLSKQRMRNIASLAGDEKDNLSTNKKSESIDDGFGRNDEDWMIYRQIQMGRSGDDGESSGEEDAVALEETQTLLEKHDPDFYDADEENHKESLLDRFWYGPIMEKEEEELDDKKYENVDSMDLDEYDEEENGKKGQQLGIQQEQAQKRKMIALQAERRMEERSMAKQHQIHLNVERAKVPEIFFQPLALVGLDKAGVGELIETILRSYPTSSIRERLAANIFVTGGCAMIPGMRERIYQQVRPIISSDKPVNVKLANDPVLDAWHGASMVAKSIASKSFASSPSRSAKASEYYVTREMYLEHGSNVFIEHPYSNQKQ